MSNNSAIIRDNTEAKSHNKASSRDDTLRHSADIIIRDHSIAAGALGVIPVPLVDFVCLTIVQTRMIKKLCQLHKQPYRENHIKSLLVSLAGSYSSGFIKNRLLTSWMKFIPSAALTSGAAATAFTYAVGNSFLKNIEAGKSPSRLDKKTLEDDLSECSKETEHDQKPVQKTETISTCETRVGIENADTSESSSVTNDVDKSNDDSSLTNTTTDAPSSQHTEPDIITAVTQTSSAGKPENFAQIDGIGPKMAELLRNNGVNALNILANTEVTALQELLNGAGTQFRRFKPEFWPVQAKLVLNEDWKELDKLKRRLKNPLIKN